MLFDYKYIKFILSQSIKWLNLHGYDNLLFMKKHIIFLALVSMFMLTGCDFFRRMAGRPTSDEIEAMRVEKLRVEEQRLQAEIVALEEEKQAVKDSIEALKLIRQQEGTLLNPSALGGLFSTKLEARYCVIVGSFRYRSNAERLFKTVSDKGYSPSLISFRSGMTAVGICPVNSLKEAMNAVAKVRGEAFCPDDVWILDNE